MKMHGNLFLSLQDRLSGEDRGQSLRLWQDRGTVPCPALGSDMLYKINNATISLKGEVILSHIDFEIHGKEKMAITGRNGAGKTTLLRFIMGEISEDRDDKRDGKVVETSEKISVEMLKQTGFEDNDKTVYELMGDSEEWEFDRIFTGFGFEKSDKEKKLKEFSGGEQTKIEMIRLLLSKPDILLLDEPTNHLDIQAVEWLEDYLKNYEKAVIFVSHDRFFIDKVADLVYEISDKELKRYVGNYTDYRRQKRENYSRDLKAYNRYEAEKKRLTELIEKNKNKPQKASFARAKRSMLERMEVVKKPKEDKAHIFVGNITPIKTGPKRVMTVEKLSCGYDKRVICELSLTLSRGDKVAIVGENGAGKTTFLKTIVGKLKPQSGKIIIGNEVNIGYFDQMSADISSELSVFEFFRAKFPGMVEKDLHTTLANFLFSGKDAYKKVDSLSKGERSRLVLAVLLTSRPNFLILDEPTNHMDIDAMETIESALMAYSGTILLVSHDRYLVNRLAHSFYIFSDEKVLFYPFSYEHYLERQNREQIMGLVTAQEASLIAKLRAVPKKERHEIGFKSEYEETLDWEQRLASEDLMAARERVENAKSLEEYEAALEALTIAESKTWK